MNLLDDDDVEREEIDISITIEHKWKIFKGNGLEDWVIRDSNRNIW